MTANCDCDTTVSVFRAGGSRGAIVSLTLDPSAPRPSSTSRFVANVKKVRKWLETDSFAVVNKALPLSRSKSLNF